MSFLEHRSDIHQPRFKRSASVGIVSDRMIDEKRGPLERVTFEDTGKTSPWLPVAQKGTYGKQHLYLHRKGERVIVHRLSTGLEAGVVGDALYCSAVSAPTVTNSDVDYTEYDDGSFIFYDPVGKKWVINLQGEADITTVGKVKIQATGDVDVTTSGNLNAVASGTAKVQASTITLQGNVSITGTLTVSGATTVQDINILGTETGGGPI